MFSNASTFILVQCITIYGSYSLGGVLNDIITMHRGLGIAFGGQLKFYNHATQVTSKAN